MLAINTLFAYATTTSSTEQPFATTTSEGCAEGWGYYVDDPTPICEPLDAIGEDPPKDVAFCAAHGCPYNLPNLHGQPVAPAEPQTGSEPTPDLNSGFACVPEDQECNDRLIENQQQPEETEGSDQPGDTINSGEDNEGGNSNEEQDDLSEGESSPE